MESHFLFTGTYGEKAYRFSYNPQTMEARVCNPFEVENSSYIALSEDKRFLYAITESGEHSAITSFTVDGVKINSIALPGADPCFLVNYHGTLFTANYSSGSVTVIPTDMVSGSLLPVSQKLFFKGSGPVTRRQVSSHIHTVAVIETSLGAFLLATDLGADRIHIMQIAKANGQINLTPLMHEIQMLPGSGPRHIALLPSRHVFYVLCELSGMIYSFRYDDSMNCFPLQSIVSDPSGAQASADIHIHPCGKFLYTSTRKINDGIELFHISAGTSLLSAQGHKSTLPHPRNFIFTPDGNHLLCASKDTSIIQIFSINPTTGHLTDTHKTITTAPEQPVCLVMI